MYALLDTSDPEQIHLALVNGLSVKDYFFARANYSLLQAVIKSLEEADATLSSLTGVAVVVGLGRFTATRIATVVGNTLAYALRMPVVAVSSFNPGQAAVLLQSRPPGEYIVPVYSAGAHIGGRPTQI